MRCFILGLNVLAPAAAVLWGALGHGYLALASLLVAHAFWLVATLVPSCSWWGKVVTEFQTREKELWLTIDDGPDPQETPVLLDLLDQHGARAIFFFIGDKAAQYPHLVSEVVRRGHIVGNHTQSHPAGTFWSYSRRKLRAEIAGCSQTLANCGASHVTWFRAPAGFRNHGVHPLLAASGLRLMGWSRRGFDGVRADPEKVYRRLCAGIRPGAILLLHEGRGTAVALVSRLLQRMGELGYCGVLPALDPTATVKTAAPIIRGVNENTAKASDAF